MTNVAKTNGVDLASRRQQQQQQARWNMHLPHCCHPPAADWTLPHFLLFAGGGFYSEYTELPMSDVSPNAMLVSMRPLDPYCHESSSP